MRIVQGVGWYFPESLGGTELYVRALARGLKQAGHDVCVAAPDPRQAAAREYVDAGIEVYRYPIPAAPTRDEARGRVPVRGAEQFARWLDRLRPDVVHLHTFVTGLGLSEVAAARAAGARAIVTTHSASLGYLCERGTLLRDGVHLCDARVAPRVCAACALEARGLAPSVAGAITAAGDRVPWLRRLPGRLGTAFGLGRLVAERRAAQADLLARIDAIVVLSEWARQTLVANGAPPQKVVVNRLGIAAEPGGWTRKPDPDVQATRLPVTVGYLGRAEGVKGLDDLVGAMLALPPDVPLRLDAVVAASSAAELQALDCLRDAALHDPRVRILDAVGPEQVPDVLAGFDVLCCPSRVVEGGPTVALEAHAVGTPVIGSDLPALSEIVTPDVNGALYPAADRGALGRLLLDLACQPALIDRWRRDLPSPRRFDAVVADYLALYSTIRTNVPG